MKLTASKKHFHTYSPARHQCECNGNILLHCKWGKKSLPWKVFLKQKAKQNTNMQAKTVFKRHLIFIKPN